jgi:ribosome-associated protein
MKTPPKTKAAAKTAAPAKRKVVAKTPAKAPAKARAAAKGKAAAKAPAKTKIGKPKNKAMAKAGPGPKAAAKKKTAGTAAVDPSAALKALAIAALEDLKAVDIKVLDVRELTPITDHMVICTGTSNRHVKSLAENVMDQAKQKGFRPIGVEGLGEGEWVLVDLNGVLVHVMQAQPRLFYQLEKLWDMSGAGSRID